MAMAARVCEALLNEVTKWGKRKRLSSNVVGKQPGPFCKNHVVFAYGLNIPANKQIKIRQNKCPMMKLGCNDVCYSPCGAVRDVEGTTHPCVFIHQRQMMLYCSAYFGNCGWEGKKRNSWTRGRGLLSYSGPAINYCMSENQQKPFNVKQFGTFLYSQGKLKNQCRWYRSRRALVHLS